MQVTTALDVPSLVGSALRRHSQDAGAVIDKAAGGGGDALELSAPAKLAADLDARLPPLNLGNINEDQSRRLAEFHASLKQSLQERGIDGLEGARLLIGADGHVVVAGEHPRKAEIEQIFRDERPLRDNFSRISAQGSLLQAVKEAYEFQRAYREDPVGAVQRFHYLFERQGPLPFMLDLGAIPSYAIAFAFH